MPIFDYKCPNKNCQDLLTDVWVGSPDQPVYCLNCETLMSKDFTDSRVAFRPDIPEHYNESLGVVVKSRRDLREKLYMTNSRTEDIDPVGGLTPEERSIRNKEPIPILNKTIFEKRKQLGWGHTEMIKEVEI